MPAKSVIQNKTLRGLNANLFGWKALRSEYLLRRVRDLELRVLRLLELLCLECLSRELLRPVVVLFIRRGLVLLRLVFDSGAFCEDFAFVAETLSLAVLCLTLVLDPPELTGLLLGIGCDVLEFLSLLPP